MRTPFRTIAVCIALLSTASYGPDKAAPSSPTTKRAATIPESVQDTVTRRSNDIQWLLLALRNACTFASMRETIRALGEHRAEEAIDPLIALLRNGPKRNELCDPPSLANWGEEETVIQEAKKALVKIGGKACRAKILDALTHYYESVPSKRAEDGTLIVEWPKGFEARTQFRARLVRVLVDTEGLDTANLLVKSAIDKEKAQGEKADKTVLGNLGEAEKELIAHLIGVAGE